MRMLLVDLRGGSPLPCPFCLVPCPLSLVPCPLSLDVLLEPSLLFLSSRAGHHVGAARETLTSRVCAAASGGRAAVTAGIDSPLAMTAPMQNALRIICPPVMET